MKNWTVLVFLTAVMGWSSANAEYDPDSYVYGRFSLGTIAANEEWGDNTSDIGTGLGVGYTRNLSKDWNIFGGVRYEYVNTDLKNIVHSSDDSYLSHLGVALEWRPNYTPDKYLYVNLFFGKNSGRDWIDSGTMGSGYGVGYTMLLHRKYNIFGTAFYDHYSQLLAGAPFNEKEETHLDRIGLYAELRW
jgi:hypothetical protein